MIQRVWENCQKTKIPGFEIEAHVVTDDNRIEEHINSFGGNVCRVDDDVPSGSERISLALERHFSDREWDLAVNVQGDEPLLKSDLLERIIHFHLNSSYDIATVVKPYESREDDFFDANKVKVVFSKDSGKCHYFSRAPIPYDREGNTNAGWHLHIGIYSYRPKALKSFCKSNEGYFEGLERLEQLRALEMGMTLGAIESHEVLMGVDVPEDIKKLEGVIGE
jgi:3-deoxy-manno-octulosonate cytidylyltransferase (CMP-KDO synthetase)